jgi:hypothetical protein
MVVVKKFRADMGDLHVIFVMEQKVLDIAGTLDALVCVL